MECPTPLICMICELMNAAITGTLLISIRSIPRIVTIWLNWRLQTWRLPRIASCIHAVCRRIHDEVPLSYRPVFNGIIRNNAVKMTRVRRVGKLLFFALPFLVPITHVSHHHYQIPSPTAVGESLFGPKASTSNSSAPSKFITSAVVFESLSIDAGNLLA